METFKEFINGQPTWQYIGIQPDETGIMGPRELFNNLVPVGKYKKPNFTLTRKTVESLGFTIPPNLKVGDKF